jgi:hypothetical protein
MRRLLTFPAILAVLSCGEPPALVVGDVTYSDADLLGLTPIRRDDLAALTAFGAAVAGGSLQALGRPLVEQGVQRRFAELLRAQQALDSLGIHEDALRAHYEGSPEMELTVRHLIVMSARHEPADRRESARSKATRALERIRAGESFPVVAADVSEEPGAEGRQGLLPPGREGSWVDEFWGAALALAVGGISPVVETRYGFHVLRLEDRRAIPFEEARGAVALDVAERVGLRPGEAPPVPEPLGLSIAAEEALLARLLDPSAPDTIAAVRWDGGALTLGELRDRLATLAPDVHAAALDPERPPTLEDEARAAVRWKAAADLARARGFPAEEAFESRLTLEWTDQASFWAASLGFREGMAPEAVKAASLEALGTTSQNAAIARSELLERAPLIRRGYRLSPRGGRGGGSAATETGADGGP